MAEDITTDDPDPEADPAADPAEPEADPEVEEEVEEISEDAAVAQDLTAILNVLMPDLNLDDLDTYFDRAGNVIESKIKPAEPEPVSKTFKAQPGKSRRVPTGKGKAKPDAAKMTDTEWMDYMKSMTAHVEAL